MADFDRARFLLRRFKGNAYLFGTGVLREVGKVAERAGKLAALIRGTFAGSNDYVKTIQTSLAQAGIELVAEIKGARPNTPRQDVSRIAAELKIADPDVLISFGGGSTIDATKTAEVLCTLGGRIDSYFGAGLVSAQLNRFAKTGKSLRPHVAIQTVASGQLT